MIIFDLDGTLADCSHRRHFILPTCTECNSILNQEIEFDLGWHCLYPCDNVTHKTDWKPNWKAFYEACDQDTVIQPVAEMWNNYEIDIALDRCNLQIWSGRCESVREKTIEWLNNNLYGYSYRSSIEFWNSILKMRPIGDYTPDEQLKEGWLKEAIVEGKTVDFVFDDRPKVIRMWRRNGIFVFNCNQSGEEF